MTPPTAAPATISDAPSGSCQIAFVLLLPEFGNATGPVEAAPDAAGSVGAVGLESSRSVKSRTATQIAAAATRMPFASAVTRMSVRDGQRSSNTPQVVPIRVSMHGPSESATISLDRPRTIVLYVLYGIGCFVVSIAVADLALLALSRHG